MWLLGSICGFIPGTIVVKALILPFPYLTSPPYPVHHSNQELLDFCAVETSYALFLSFLDLS